MDLMELVIKIPASTYNALKEDADCDTINLKQAIANGTLLPKNHGKLKDTDALKLNLTRPIFDDHEQEVIWKAIDFAETIVEASKEK